MANTQTAYTGTPNPSNPAATQGLYPLWNFNAPASEYSGQYGFDETIHLQRAIFNEIKENFPAQFNIFRILFSKPVQYMNSDEFTWTEEAWPRPILTIGTGAIASTTTQTLVLTSGGTAGVAVGDSVWYPDGTQGWISSITASTETIVVSVLTGGSVPAISAGEKLVPGTPIIADGMNSFVHYDRATTVQHTNYVMIGQRNRRWTNMTMLKMQNAGTTDYLAKDAKLTMMNAQLDAFQSFFNGTKGNAQITYPVGTGLTGGAYNAKTTWGVFPFMKSNGSQHATSTPATLEADFRQLSFNTNYKNVDVPRFILGSDKALNSMAKVLKNPIRYFPENMTYNMNLDEYKIGTMKYVPIVTPLFESRSGLFPAAFENRLLVLDIDTIDPICMKGLQPFSYGSTTSMQKGNGGYQDYIDFYVSYAVGMKQTNVDSSFWIDLVGI